MAQIDIRQSLGFNFTPLKGRNPMPKKKTKPAKKKTPGSHPTACDFCRFIGRVLQGSRDINQTDKLALAELVKNLKD